LGEILLASDGSALCGAWFAGQKYFPLRDGWTEAREDRVLQKAAWELERYFAGDLRIFSVPLAPQGTPFQEKVWAGIADIPYGRTESYGALAARLRSGPRAVGAATGRNPVSLFIPCHRVIGRDGHITGYAGGLEKKKRLLTLEGIKLDGHRREKNRS
jgi:methylated-DNA-[protein]-cysteine S-methyltransferase